MATEPRRIAKVGCSISEWMPFFDKYGYSSVVLVAVALALWKVARWLSPKLETWVGMFFQLQQERTKLLEAASLECRDMQEANGKLLSELLTVMRGIEVVLKERK